MSTVSDVSMWLQARRWLDRFAAYLPIVLMALMAMTTY